MSKHEIKRGPWKCCGCQRICESNEEPFARLTHGLHVCYVCQECCPDSIVDVGCIICGHEWEAVFPVNAEEIECPACGHVQEIT